MSAEHDSPAKAKSDRIYASGTHGSECTARVLLEYAHLLPAAGSALDLACGMGGNALLLAAHGLRTCAWDISRGALDALAIRAEALGLQLRVEQRDAVARPPEPDTFDVIVVSRFLDRTLISHLCSALRDRGLIFYQTFINEKTQDLGPRNPDYRLGANELLRLFKSLHILVYREEGTTGDTARGFRNEALLVAQRR